MAAKPKAPKVNKARKTESGTVIDLGIITTDEYLQELIGHQGLTMYDNMMRSNATVSEVIDLVTLPLRTAKYDIPPVSEDKRDIEVADYVKAALFESMNITWPQLIESIVEMMPFGFSLFEKVYKTIEWNGQEKFGLDLHYIGQKSVYAWQTEDGKPGITQMTDNGHKASVPEENLLRFTYRQRGDDYQGRSILRSAYVHWYNVVNFYKISGIAYERGAIGVPMVSTPPNASPTDKTKAENIAKNMRANEHAFASLPEGYKLEILDMKGNTVIDPMPLISHHNVQIARAALTEFMHLGQTPNGSHAASYDQSTMFEKSEEAVAIYIQGVINTLIREIVNINFFDVKEYPKMIVSDITRQDLNSHSTNLQRLYQSGAITPDLTTEQAIRRTFGLPEKATEEVDPLRPNEMQTEDDGAAKATATKKKDERQPTIAENKRNNGAQWSRPLTASEKKVNFDSLQSRIDRGEDSIKEKLGNLSEQQIEAILLQVRTAVQSDNPIVGLQSIAAPLQNEYGDVLTSELRALFEYAKVLTADEMEKILGQGTVNAPSTTTEEVDKILLKATTIAAQHATSLATEASTTAAEFYAAGRAAEEIEQLVGDTLKKKAEKRIADTAGIAVSGSVNQGRTFTQETNSAKIYAYQYSAILDMATCRTCTALDGRTIAKNDPAYLRLMPPQHFYCRCVWVEILNDEFDKPSIDGVPDEISRDQTPGTFKQITEKELKNIEDA